MMLTSANKALGLRMLGPDGPLVNEMQHHAFIGPNALAVNSAAVELASDASISLTPRRVGSGR